VSAANVIFSPAGTNDRMSRRAMRSHSCSRSKARALRLAPVVAADYKACASNKRMKYKAVRVYFNGERMRDVYPYATRWEVCKYKAMIAARKASMIGIVAAAVYGGVKGDQLFNSNTVAYAQVIKVVQVQPGRAPVMQRIADCESGDHGKRGSARQFMPNGDIVVHYNTDGSSDVGEWQINQSPEHIKIEARMHFDVLTEAGNEAMATWIYQNEGTGPWKSSQACWQ